MFYFWKHDLWYLLQLSAALPEALGQGVSRWRRLTPRQELNLQEYR